MDDISDDSPKECPTSLKTEPDSGLCTKGIEPQLKKLRSSFDGERDETNTFAEKSKPEKSRTTFKALGNVVLAMKRFQASLNTTYTYGKQQHVVRMYVVAVDHQHNGACLNYIVVFTCTVCIWNDVIESWRIGYLWRWSIFFSRQGPPC